MVPRECDWLLAAAARLVPRSEREAWQSRWSADLWFHEREAVRAGKTQPLKRLLLWQRSAAACADAAWQRFDREGATDRIAALLRSPWFCLGVLAAILVGVLALSGGATASRRAWFGPPYPAAGRVVTVAAQDPLFPRRDSVPPATLSRVGPLVHSFEDFAAYTMWRSWLAKDKEHFIEFPRALVSPSFFHVLGVRAAQGRVLEPGDESACADCIVVTDRFRRELLHGVAEPVGQSVVFDGRRWRIAGVLPGNFWFLAEPVGVYSVLRSDSAVRSAIGIARLRPGVDVRMAEKELRALPGGASLDVESLAGRLRDPLQTLGGGTVLLLAALAVTIGVRARRLPTQHWYFLFGWLKCALGLTLILLIALELTGIGELTSTAVQRETADLLAFWIWIAGTLLFLRWALADQRRRCRICQRRLVLPVRIGPTDRVLFDHEGTETLCPAGHGTLYVDGVTESYRTGERWTRFDDSWSDLFPGGKKK